jgi:hypothetical protein
LKQKVWMRKEGGREEEEGSCQARVRRAIKRDFCLGINRPIDQH